MANVNINLNDPTQNQQYTDMGGAANYALTMGQGIDPKTGKPYGQVAGGVGSVAIPWVKSSGVGSNFLPDSVKAALYGIDAATGLARQSAQGYDPFADATGYAYDPTSGALIIQNKNGSSSFLGNTGYIQDASGNFVPGTPTGNTGAGTGGVTGSGSSDGSNTGGTPAATKKVVSTYADPTTGDVIATYDDGSTATLAKSGAKQAGAQSAYDLLYQQFNDMGIGSLVEPLKQFITEGISPAEFTLRLQQTPEYQQRFAANKDRIAKGLAAITPAEYIALEDQYQNIMRNYGLPESYYAKGNLGTQEGFQKLIGSDVSATELENRIATAQQRVINSNPEVLKALKQFYPDINNADILAYALDPKNALNDIQRKVSAAEIGGAALSQGLQAQGGTAESLAGYGITKAQAQQGYTDIAGMLPTASKLSDIYGQGAYTQGTAEAEVFNTAGAANAIAKRKKLTGLETAAFSGSSGVGALNRDRPISNYMMGQPGAGSY